MAWRLAALAGLVLLLAGCGARIAPDPEASAGAVHHFAGGGVSFDYPAQWGAAQFEVVSSFSNSIVYLSTAPLADPCDRGLNSIACIREAAATLGPDGILVEWSGHGFPGWTFDPTKGRRAAVAGRPATIEDAVAIEGCQGIGGEREIVVTITRPEATDNWTEVRACLRGPDLDALRAEVDAMLASVAWH